MKKIIIEILRAIYSIFNNLKRLNPKKSQTDNIDIAERIDKDAYTLNRSFWFYKGSKKRCDIETITFSRDIPEKYDECWNANAYNTEHIKGYLIGNDVIIVGKYIYANKICHNMFAAHNGDGGPLWSNLNKINGLDLINTSLVEDMSMMFAFTQLTEINGIGKWDVSNVKTFAGMFQGDSHKGNIKPKYLDVGKWNTSSATNMSHVFYGCALMEYIPIENWDVSKVTTFSHMFADCYGLKSIDFSKWETSSVVSFDCLLNDCRSLTVVDVGNLKTRTCTQFSQMFEACINLEHIVGLDKWDVSNASDYAFSETFHCCYKLKEVDIGSWVTSPDNTARMFKNCYSLTEIDLSGFDMTNVKYDEEMFMGCNAIVKKKN